MKLVESGLVNLDQPVQQYLRDWQFSESNHSEAGITIRRLLSHIAGLPLGTIGVRYAPDDDIPSLRESLSQEARLIQEPGSSFLYSNVGYHVLELLVEEVTGRDFAEYMAQEVLRPLGMTTASFSWNEALRPQVPTAYDLQGTPIPIYVYPEKASGGLLAPVEDVARFVTAAMTGSPNAAYPVLARNSIRSLYTPEVEHPGIYSVVADAYGFGHFLEEMPEKQQAVWHGGQGTGWMTHFHAVPESGDGIVILTNSQRSWPLISQVLSDWAGLTPGFHPLKIRN